MNKNKSIKCCVTECKHHNKDGHYCALDEIQVTKHNNLANSIEHTDCGSFETK